MFVVSGELVCVGSCSGRSNSEVDLSEELSCERFLLFPFVVDVVLLGRRVL